MKLVIVSLVIYSSLQQTTTKNNQDLTSKKPMNHISLKVDSYPLLLKKINRSIEENRLIYLLCQLDSCIYSNEASEEIEAELEKHSQKDTILLKMEASESSYCAKVLNTTRYPSLYVISREMNIKKIQYEQNIPIDRLKTDKKGAPLEDTVGRKLSRNWKQIRTIIYRIFMIYQDKPLYFIYQIVCNIIIVWLMWKLSDWVPKQILSSMFSDNVLDQSGFSSISRSMDFSRDKFKID